MQIAILGLGKMGGGIALKLLKEGHEVVVWNRSTETVENFKFQISNFKFKKEKLKIAESIKDAIGQLKLSRVVWSMLPAGEATEEILTEIGKYIEKDDIVIDGGNANFKDTERRFEDYSAKEIKFLGIGVSGGVHAFKNGYCMMVGGDVSAYEYIKPVLDSLAKPDGIHTYFGLGGAGHFVKMVHNGIEYGMMQSIAVGFGILQKSKYKLDLVDVAKNWQSGSIVSSFLVGMAKDALSKDATLSSTDGAIGESGEGKWTVEAAKEEDVPVLVIEKSLEFRKKSQVDEKTQKSFTAKLVQALRHEFGGHGEKKS